MLPRVCCCRVVFVVGDDDVVVVARHTMDVVIVDSNLFTEAYCSRRGFII